MTKKESILTAAQEAFGQNGYSRTTMKDVSTRANVSFGLVSHYYGNKQDLFIAAGSAMVDSVIEHLREATGNAKNGLDAIHNYMTAYFDFTNAHRMTFPVLLRCSPFSHIEPGVDASRVAEKFQVIIDTIRECVSMGITDGSIREMPVEEASLIIYGNIVGAVRTKLLTPYGTDNIYDETTKFTLRSLKPQSADCG
ncbi:TetR/AcrR family transcriptional regulator [Desulfovibrio oxyclinae]|jgi:AcrR family transcriptional regulator|uniref:TetR/AcrR family transcriptional regulator n=1 Tax=Desulfovibrio oxyclinae TaxID=63560 RepID=UPI00035EAC65|nr:TetR/AcrR family transcriptional regulator [Desulfovibrio oxyclinae]